MACEARGNAMWAAWPTVPSIAAIWACVVSIMISQSQQIHDAPSLGPGSVSNAASVVLPCVIAYRPSSTCTNTLITQLSRISQSKREAGLGPQTRRVDQLTGAHDRRGQDQARSDLPDRAGERTRRLPDRIGRQSVQILGFVSRVAHAVSPFVLGATEGSWGSGPLSYVVSAQRRFQTGLFPHFPPR